MILDHIRNQRPPHKHTHIDGTRIELNKSSVFFF